MESKLPLIQFKNFSFQYRAQKAPTLHDINLSIYAGEKVLIIGPSGSGKSTLAHCINGLIPFNYKGKIEGSLKISGKETLEMDMFELSKVVGTVLQDPDGQFVGLTAGEDIAFSLENNAVPQGEMIPRVQAAADKVGVGVFLNHSPFDLSGGQKQRVSLAGVLIDRVKVLLFDEPLANLDPATGKQAIELIDDLMEDENAVIIIEHRLEDVLHRKVDRVILMDEGRILADMPPDRLLCTGLLKTSGIREPLYLTALKYAGLTITESMRPGSMDTLRLSEEECAQVKNGFLKAEKSAKEKSTEPLLRVEGLSFKYDAENEALQDVSFSVLKGEMAAIAGTNGAGKSTLAKLICGFEKLKSGRVLLNGTDLAPLGIAKRAGHIGYVMQNPNQMISKTMIYDEVALGLQPLELAEGEMRQRVEETLKICGLYPFRNWPISALSFGQKKRVTIAAVLVMAPEIIILDEPTAGQDFRHYTDIMEFLRGLNRQGVTVLMITHDMHLMLEYATRALVFSGGRLIRDTTPAKALTDAGLIAQASLKETSLYALAQKVDAADETAFVQCFIDRDREVSGRE